MKSSFEKLLILLLILLSLPTHAALSIDIIVNVENPADSITATDVTNYFMKKERKWPDGNAVRFFDYRDENKSRAAFLKTYINKTSREIELFWIGEKIYTGNIAPIQITSDSMMVSMVSRFPGGIGYISKTAPISKNVKRLKVVQANQ